MNLSVECSNCTRWFIAGLISFVYETLFPPANGLYGIIVFLERVSVCFFIENQFFIHKLLDWWVIVVCSIRP